MPALFLLITEGFRIRNLLFSEVLSGLSRSWRVIILVPADSVEPIAAEFAGPNVCVEAIPPSRSRWESKFVFVRRYLLSNPARNRTVSVFSSVMKREQPFHHWLVRNVNPWLGRLSWVRAWWLWFEAQINRGEEFVPLFERYQPSLVVTSDYGSQTQEIRLLRQSRHRGVRTASVVYSWDNLSSKGIMGAQPDRLIVWNEIMRREAAELHDIPLERTVACGAAQFDIYGRRHELASRQEFCRRMGLDPQRPILVLGTIPPRYYSHNLEVLDLLAQAILDGRLPQECQILVRMHPQVMDAGSNADSPEPYLEYERKHPFVRIDRPKVRKWGRLLSPDRGDARHLAEILAHAAVLIHPGSTLVVDASAMDCPSIGLGFDGYAERPYDESIRRWWDFTYMKPILQSGGQPVASSPNHLLELIRSFLSDRTLHADGRALIRDWECHKVDGNAAHRVVESLVGKSPE